MTGWDLHPSQINDVLRRTLEVAEKLEGQARSYGGHLESAATSAGTLAMPGEPPPAAGLVGAALGEFAERTRNDLLFIAVRSARSLDGAGLAARAYLSGDVEMAEEWMRHAAAPVTAMDLHAPTAEETAQRRGGA
ncbi:DUF6507 family protein [Streptomyces sp. TRM 70351]|uniref:DUF6507 family protein n=1 Tax=Streptomyces sp. TRM 70351 TaxID=3116552 RepID=UPI002E7C1522|nr:DUF6507 family protein [Streptomyces sp. TRM 70351]MEE1930911.1 DUF6507 family protein [Streptomyces sp. TRM 70351]